MKIWTGFFLPCRSIWTCIDISSLRRSCRVASSADIWRGLWSTRCRSGSAGCWSSSAWNTIKKIRYTYEFEMSLDILTCKLLFTIVEIFQTIMYIVIVILRNSEFCHMLIKCKLLSPKQIVDCRFSPSQIHHQTSKFVEFHEKLR